MNRVCACRGILREAIFVEDRRGAVSFEMIIVFAVVMFSVLLPLADLAVAGFKFISAYQLLRDIGQHAQFAPPDDAANGVAAWRSSIGLPMTTADGYTVAGDVHCTGDCASGASVSKYYTFTATFALSPIVLGNVLCSSCSVSYSQPFQ